MVDRRRDTGDGTRHGAGRSGALETVGKFLGDEGGGELAGAPARMLHDRREKRNVVANTFDGEGIKRVGLRVDCLDRGSSHA